MLRFFFEKNINCIKYHEVKDMHKYYFYKVGGNYTFDKKRAIQLSEQTKQLLERKYVLCESKPTLQEVILLDKSGHSYS